MRFTKTLLLAIFLLCFYSCRDEKKEKFFSGTREKENSLTIQDSFNLRNLEEDPSLLSDIHSDTIHIDRNKKHTGIYIVSPLLSEKNDPELFKWTRDLLDADQKEFYEMVKNDEVIDDTTISYFPQGWSMFIHPRLLYKTDSVASFAIESGQGYTGMPAGFWYNTFNYDIARKKEIYLNDFFILTNEADRLFLKKIISRAIGHDVIMDDFLAANDGSEFAFDNRAVYFFFDKYHPWGWGIYSVERKYISEHINPVYR